MSTGALCGNLYDLVLIMDVSSLRALPLTFMNDWTLCLLSFSADSPVLWLRMDKDLNLLRSVVWEQPDYMWQYQLRYERDVVAQCDVSLTYTHSTL